MVQFLNGHGIQLIDRPGRRQNMTEAFERKNQTIKTILERLQNDTSRSSDAMIISRAKFLSDQNSSVLAD